MLTLVLGDKKSGKTHFILDLIKDNKDCTLIVPEQTLFKYESLILDRLGEESAFLVNTLSFKKLALSIIKDNEKYNEIKLLDNDTRALIIERILMENKDNMTAFKKAMKKPEFSNEIASQLTEFKKYLITSSQLSKLAKKEEISKGLKEKLFDLSIIFGAYEKKTEELFKDTDDIITASSEKILKDGLFKGKQIYIDGFTGFTKDELYMTEAFLRNGADVYITLPYNQDKAMATGELYYSVTKAIEKIEKLCERVNTKLDKKVLKECRIESEDIKFLKENYNEDTAYSKNAEDIRIYNCKNPYDECVNLTSQIIKNITEEGASLSDIAVILPDIKSYIRYIDSIFNDFLLSYFCNEKVSVYDMSVAMLLNNLFDMIVSSNRMEPVIDYLKSGYFFRDDLDKIYRFENFIKEKGVRVYTLFSKNIEDIIEEKKLYNFEIENEEDLISVYQKVIAPVKELKKKLEGEKTADRYSYLLYEFFIQIGLPDALKKFADEYDKEGDLIKSDRLIQVYNYITESMERTSVVLKGLEISFLEYKSIIVSSLKNKNIASVPILNDSVTISDLKGFCDNSYKYVYILGATEGRIPDTSFSEGIINEEERYELLKTGTELSMSHELKLCENYLKLYDALTSPSKRLCVSYPLYDKNGEEYLRGDFVSELTAMFGDKIIASGERILSKRELLKDTLCDLSRRNEPKKTAKYLLMDKEYGEFIKKAVKELDKSTVTDVLVSKGKLKKLIGNQLNLSVTNMEKYRGCAFSYFIRYVLKAKEKSEYKIDNAGIGSMLHHILDTFSKKLKKDNLDFSSIDDSYIRENVERIVNKSVATRENGVFLADVKSSYMIKRVKRTAEYAIGLLKLHFTKGTFKPVDFELSFGRDDSKANPLVFDIGEDRKIVLNGVIDRVDTLESEEGEYVRIVDYKSSAKGVDFYEIFSGMKIQLAIYLLTMLKQKNLENIKPGGMLYLTLDSPIISVKNSLDTEDIELKIRKNHIMTGIFLNNEDVLSAMDSELKEGTTSEILDVKFDKSGLLNGKNNLTLDEFSYMLSKVSETVKKEAESIFDGQFKIKPVLCGGKSACTYCPYSAICRFEETTCSFDVIEKTPKDELFNIGDSNGKN